MDDLNPMDSVNSNSHVYVLTKPRADDPAKSLSQDYAQALNPQQLAAVDVVDGPALVIARDHALCYTRLME